MENKSSRRTPGRSRTRAPDRRPDVHRQDAAGSQAGAAGVRRIQLSRARQDRTQVTSLGFGCMITSDQSVIERGPISASPNFDSARGYQNGNNERWSGRAPRRSAISINPCPRRRRRERKRRPWRTLDSEPHGSFVDRPRGHLGNLHGQEQAGRADGTTSWKRSRLPRKRARRGSSA